MKIAYLILAHHQPEQMIRLINALNSTRVSFFIHVDLKCDIYLFNNFNLGANVVFINKRILVNHSGFSQVRAMIKLIQTASAFDNFDYFIFLSGNDYPIKDNDYIYSYLKNNYPTNYISFYPLVENADFITYIKKYYFLDFIKNSPKFLHKPLWVFQWILGKVINNRPFLKGMVPFRGSTSWCLNKQTIEYIINFLESKKTKKIIRFFKYVWDPDEIFFQTIILNSPFAEQCRFYNKDVKNSKLCLKNENKAYLHYINWDRDREGPAILNMRDLKLLKECDFLFARKFDESKSQELLDSLDKYMIAKANNIFL